MQSVLYDINNIIHYTGRNSKRMFDVYFHTNKNEFRNNKNITTNINNQKQYTLLS